MSCSENSSEETDQQELEDESGGSKARCYECTFCRRGFTNAQALGGHMNIHRKDRAKAKQVTPTPTPNSASSQNKLLSNNYEESLSASPFVSEISGQYQYYSIFDAQRNYNMYFHPSTAPNPRNPHAHHASYDYLNPTSHSHHHHHHQSVDLNQELLGSNLSLQIGPSSHVENNEVVRRSGIHKDGELDLELRLGHHHPY